MNGEKKEFLLNTIPQQSTIIFTVPKKKAGDKKLGDWYFEGRVIDVHVCACIAWGVDKNTGDLKCKLVTKKLRDAENTRVLKLNMKIVCDLNEGKEGEEVSEKEYNVAIRALITREFVKLKM